MGRLGRLSGKYNGHLSPGLEHAFAEIDKQLNETDAPESKEISLEEGATLAQEILLKAESDRADAAEDEAKKGVKFKNE